MKNQTTLATKTLATTLALLSFGLSSFAHADGITKIEGGRYIVAANVPAQQSKMLESDLAYLQTMQISPDPALQKVMETNAPLTAASMDQWLSERVQYIVGEETNPSKSLTPILMGFPFQSQGSFPLLYSLENPPDINLDDAPVPQHLGRKPVTVMANLSPSSYLQGKATGTLMGFNVPGAGTVPMSSPRAGVIQIGEGLFMPLFKRFGQDDVNSRFYVISRLGTLFHEARHSDGNGESLGMLHVTCPLGHDFEGSGACDLAKNGAYVTGGLFERALAASCKDCSTREKEVMKMEVLDSFNRLVKSAPKYGDVAEYQFKCAKAAQLHRQLSSEATQFCQDLAAKSVETTEASFWDARPEGARWK